MTKLHRAIKLPPKPKAPAGVKYALTVSQSVLFSELSMQGNRREFFQVAMHIDYELGYVIKDANGAISWNYDNDEVFYRAFIGKDDPHLAVRRFTTVMGTTARKLMRRSELGFGVFRRPANVEDIIEDLSDYWWVYKLHMTCLFTFWNVEQVLVKIMTEELKKEGLYTDVNDVAQFIQPAETNQFVRERRSFERLVRRFADSSNKPSPQLMAALRQHALTFNFLLNPSFSPRSDNQDDHALLERVAETRKALAQQAQPDSPDEDIALLTDMPTTIKHLALTARDLTFWKNERIDVMSLSDALIAPLYDETAKMLGLSLTDLFAMTSGEIQQSLLQGKVVVDGVTLAERQRAFCMVFTKGKIGFYQPSETKKSMSSGTNSSLQGRGASAGTVSGPVKIIHDLSDLKKIEAGDILATAMTRPEYGVALDRAAAFVTDQGGLLCHAAIIAREMKKPCVIATGNATEVLHDGIVVEVDGTAGTVKILS